VYLLDNNSKKPLHIQLFNALKDEIKNSYKVGDKLPSLRKVASLYNLSKNTVESAYSQLYAEGYIESRAKSGYYVSELFFDRFKEKKPKIEEAKEQESKVNYRYDFFPAQLHKEDFPLKLWKRIYAKVINEEIDFGAYSDGQGILSLRKEIAKYLQNSRGVRCKAQNIIITHGFIDSMQLLARLSKVRYQTFGQEIPGYHIAHKIFSSFGYDIEAIRVDSDGIMIEKVKQSKADILYITPSHQYPTGATMPVANRQKLIQYMQTINGLIIEDDYDSELAYYNRPIPSLQGLDDGETVAYLGTFAKALSPAIRVGYMVVPSWFMKLYKESYDAHFSSVSLTTQLTLTHFMSEGHWDRHIRRIRILNKKKHQIMKEALLKYLGESFKIVSEGAGLAILIVPTNPNFDWERLKTLAKKNKIAIYLAKERSGGEFEAVRMGFGGFRLDEINEAVETFGVVWMEVLE
jgi:GntR family transcriptional regulator/MocR family aminotransferase